MNHLVRQQLTAGYQSGRLRCMEIVVIKELNWCRNKGSVIRPLFLCPFIVINSGYSLEVDQGCRWVQRVQPYYTAFTCTQKSAVVFACTFCTYLHPYGRSSIELRSNN